MSRSQIKLAAALVGLVLLVVTVSGALAERRLRESELDRISRSLAEHARLVRELVHGIPFDAANSKALDGLARRAQGAVGARVTLSDSSGFVVGDSNVPLEKLPGVENHADRPEVQAALGGSLGTNARRSETVGRELFYLAVPAEANGGVIRLALDLAERDAVLAEFRRELVFAGGIGLCAALAFSVVLSWFTFRPLREMRRVASSIARGDLDHRLPLRPIEELGGISAAINQMAAEIRKRIDELTHEKEQLQAVLNGMVEGVLVLDAHGRVLLANKRMREFYGIRGPVEGRAPLEVVRDAEVDELLAEATESEAEVSRRIVSVGSVGRTFRVQAVRFPANGGPRTGTVAVFHDVTEIARLESIRRDFVANASHELRTPVAAIRGFAETLREGTHLSAEERDSYLDVINRHATRLGNLVTDLLELSKIEAQREPSAPDRVDVASVAESVMRDSREMFESRGIEFVLDAQEGAEVWASRNDIEQILTNLVGNAANYTDRGGRVEVSVAADADRVRIEVADTGIGISRADQERIFERFYRVDASRSRAAGGTGLGLAIVKHLVRNLDGEITVSSEPGKGSKFRVTIPKPEA